MIDGKPYQQIGDVRPGGIVCVADHSSNFVPDHLPLGVPAQLLDTHIAIDIGVAGVAERMAHHHDIPAHLALISRLVVDLHREEDHDHVPHRAQESAPGAPQEGHPQEARDRARTKIWLETF